MSEELPQLGTRLALSISEAADAISVSERHFRSMLPEIPHTHIGGRTVIPVKELEAWLGERAKAESAQIDRIVEGTLKKFGLESS